MFLDPQLRTAARIQKEIARIQKEIAKFKDGGKGKSCRGLECVIAQETVLSTAIITEGSL